MDQFSLPLQEFYNNTHPFTLAHAENTLTLEGSAFSHTDLAIYT